MKPIFYKLPEFYLLILAMIAGYSPPFYFNPIFVVIIIILAIQIIFQNKIFGLALGILFFLANLYFLGALLSEFNEFSEFTTTAAIQLLFVGLCIWIVNIGASFIMIYKHSTNNLKGNSSLKLEKQHI